MLFIVRLYVLLQLLVLLLHLLPHLLHLLLATAELLAQLHAFAAQLVKQLILHVELLLLTTHHLLLGLAEMKQLTLLRCTTIIITIIIIITWISNGTESARNMLLRDTSFKAGDLCVGSGAVCVERCILGTQKGKHCFGRTLVEN